MALLSLIIPCYQNVEALPSTFNALRELQEQVPDGVLVECIFVDDRSNDGSYGLLLEHQRQSPNNVVVVRLTNNVGPFNAISCGLQLAQGDCISVLSADLQDPPELLPQMVSLWQQGHKLIFTVRQRRHDSIIDRFLASIYHRLIRSFAHPNAPRDGHGTALADRQAIDALLRISQRNTNPLYELLTLGYEHVEVPYVRPARTKGRSAWTFSKKVKLFMDTFISYSAFPIRAITIGGMLLGCSAFLYALFILVANLSGSVPVKGWSAIMVAVLMIGAFQMIALGVLGEYLWRTMDSMRNRPSFLIDSLIDERAKRSVE